MKDIYIKAKQIEEPLKDMRDNAKYHHDGIYIADDEYSNRMIAVVARTKTGSPSIQLFNISNISDIVPVEDIESEKNNAVKLAVEKERSDCGIEFTKLQMSLDNPQRNGCGEWISGKTLVNIVSILSDSKKEDKK